MIKNFADRLLKWLCHPDYFDEIYGDIEELHHRRKNANKWFSQWQYLLQVLSTLRPSLLRPLSRNPTFNSMMLLNYFKISTRILVRQKLYSTINILGLAIGMGVCLLIYQYIHFEMSYDTFHKDTDRIYRLTQTVIKNGEVTAKGVDVTYGLGASMKEEIPEIKQMVRVNPQEVGLIVINEEDNVRHQENSIWYTDPEFLQLFNFPLKYGDRASALSDKHNIVLTEELAHKYFGDINPIGKEMRVSGGVLTGNFVVSGVLYDLPENTHIKFDLLMPLEYVLTHWRFYKEYGPWGMEEFVTYASFDNAANLNETAAKVDNIMEKNLGGYMADLDIEIKNGFQPITEIHLESKGFIGETAKNNGDINNMYYFGIIAAFILLIAWINFINLSTAKAVDRAKEVGVRKAIGARKNQLIYQFLFESIIINLMAAFLAVGIAYYLLSTLSTIVGKDIGFSLLSKPTFWKIFLFTILSGAILSGMYPAFVLSSFNPINALKSLGFNRKKGLGLRKALITFQFFISIILISGTYLVYEQITFMKSRDMGYRMEQILVVNGPRVILEKHRKSLANLQEQFKVEAKKHHTVESVALSSNIPSKGYMVSGNMWKVGEQKQEREVGQIIIVDTAFIETYDIQFLAREKRLLTEADIDHVIINREALKSLNFESPEDAIQQGILMDDDTLRVVGVVENLYWSSLKKKHEPMVFAIDQQFGAFYSIRINLNDIGESIAHIEKTFRKIYPEDPFEYYFLDDDFNDQYQADLQFGNLFLGFTTLAIIIACLGLFAMVSYSTSLRIKEIGIRKVLGASVTSLVVLISKEHFLLLALATLLAAPAILIGGQQWLDNYAFSIEVDATILLVPAFCMLLLAILTVGFRIYKSAKANPVQALRKE